MSSGQEVKDLGGLRRLGEAKRRTGFPAVLAACAALLLQLLAPLGQAWSATPGAPAWASGPICHAGRGPVAPQPAAPCPHCLVCPSVHASGAPPLPVSVVARPYYGPGLPAAFETRHSVMLVAPYRAFAEARGPPFI